MDTQTFLLFLSTALLRWNLPFVAIIEFFYLFFNYYAYPEMKRYKTLFYLRFEFIYLLFFEVNTEDPKII